MFDFSEEKKEKYRQRAESILKEHGLACFRISRESFSVVRNELVKVYVVPFSKKDVSNAQLATVKSIPEFHVINDRYTRHRFGKEKPLSENGYFELPLDEVDR